MKKWLVGCALAFTLFAAYLAFTWDTLHRLAFAPDPEVPAPIVMACEQRVIDLDGRIMLAVAGARATIELVRLDVQALEATVASQLARMALAPVPDAWVTVVERAR